MKQSINLSQFRDAFHSMDRGNQFSYEALELIYDYLEEIDPDFDLDVIAICCEVSEMDIGDVFNTYPISCDSEEQTEEQVKEAVMTYLYDNTSVMGVTYNNCVVFAKF
jgi:hypothetical protein